MIGIIVGMAAEAHIARVLGCPIEIGGGTPPGAEVAAEKLVAQGASAIISFGLAGGLDPAVKAGDLIVPIAVVEHGQTYQTDAVLSDALGGWFGGLLLAGQAIAADSPAKAFLWRATRACAIDLESGAVARVAARHGIPFAVLRAVCDPAGRALPPAAILALDEREGRGTIGLLRVARSLLVTPGQLGALIALARDAKRARAALVGRVGDIVRHGGLMML